MKLNIIEDMAEGVLFGLILLVLLLPFYLLWWLVKLIRGDFD